MEKRPDGQTASLWNGVFCGDCGWSVIVTCVNDEFIDFAETQDPNDVGDWWVYCTNKGCKNHIGEGKFQDEPDWIEHTD